MTKMPTNKKAIATKEAPEAIGPYSQAIECGGFLFMSGQIPLDPKTMQVVGEDVVVQTERVLKNMEGVLASRDLELSAVVKTTVFLKNMGDFPKFNEVYQKKFSQPFPARSTVEVARLPKDVLVEIEAIASLG